MKAVQIEKTYEDAEEAIENIRIVERPVPKPKSGQVLIKIEAAPCNPSDLLFMQGSYGVKKKLPAVPGFEGAGTVVESGGGLLGFWLKGKRVALAGQTSGDGTWAEYYVAKAHSCVVLQDQVSIEQGATLLINPLTAVGMVEQASAEKHEAIIQTAACSQVGKMVQAIARRKEIPLINIVRREEQVEQLESAGQRWVLNSEEPDFIDKLKEQAKIHRATIAFDAVAGQMTGQILQAMPAKAKILVYGALSKEPCGRISPLGLIFEEKRVEGFWLTKWIKEKGFMRTWQTTRFIQELIREQQFATKIRQTVGFDKWASALMSYHRKMTEGKVLLKPDSVS